jgi:hypothetical protein
MDLYGATTGWAEVSAQQGLRAIMEYGSATMR